jgi:hypothetical protein
MSCKWSLQLENVIASPIVNPHFSHDKVFFKSSYHYEKILISIFFEIDGLLLFYHLIYLRLKNCNENDALKCRMNLFFPLKGGLYIKLNV